MKTNWVIVIGLCCFLLGLAIGTGLGMQKGQYMLFEGLGKALDGAEVNVQIDLNETQLVNEMNETFTPILKELWNEGNGGVYVGRSVAYGRNIV